MSVSSLCKALALYDLLDSHDAVSEGLPQAELERCWLRTGLRTEDLKEILSSAAESGDFEIVPDIAGPRVRVGSFEQHFLNPSTLPEIETLSRAFDDLHTVQQRVIHRFQPDGIRLQ